VIRLRHEQQPVLHCRRFFHGKPIEGAGAPGIAWLNAFLGLANQQRRLWRGLSGQGLNVAATGRKRGVVLASRFGDLATDGLCRTSQPAPAEGKYHVVVYLTCSWDYGIVQFYVNGAKLGQPIDGFHNDTVITTGPIDLGEAELKKGANTLRIEVIGSNPNTRPPHYSWGLDCLKLNRLP
jgi:hypothetical protein